MRAGVSLADAARFAGVAPRTLRGWLRNGRRDPTSSYGPFARAIDDARARTAAGGTMDAGELRAVVGRAARHGSVRAMRLVWEMERPPSSFRRTPG